ncbi:hypothetical protein [Caballeronia sp. ATUFL_F1_KS4A]|uniref:hypothetical protein n=1 Tax=Caballeronia sp. ATUFL_F1_KS4A TaxID=2921768 RepID=UPI002027DD0C|nr:hypothetical protein [Caballeronia sp. ATUFL_F1_KS4A]
MNKSIVIISLGTALVSSAVDAQVKESLKNGSVCFVRFDQLFTSQGGETDCTGTIARNNPYNIQYHKSAGTWTATGPVCNKGMNNTHTDSGPSPDDGYLVVWGAKFTFDRCSV